ncbi:DUF4190 domain-containing protein [Brevibacterium renqingii]|uniref:DUF4190 domain-containing protein n=1 Tax=Brevibacterium renqingii TaxID=2776916 RepID=UPI001ADF9B25|nr:DUF4190 domain-containing protein [Brevibacterium renqingii]
MYTRQLPIGSTYTGSSHSSAKVGTVPAAQARVAMRAPVTYSNSAPVTYGSSGPVTYGSSAPVVVCQQLAPTNSSAIVAFVLSLISFVSSVFLLGFVGIIFGHIARSQIKRRGERGNGMAVAALWLSYLSVIFWILFWLAYFGVIALMIGFVIVAEGATIS